jgi:hypothetical protein
MACPAAQTPLYVRPPPPIDLDRRGFGTAPSQTYKALICRFYLLRETALP